MQCSKCGALNPPEAKFCGKCGERLVQAAPPPPVPPRTPAPVSAPGTPEDTVSEGLKIGLAIGSVVIPLLGIIMGVIYMNSPSQAKKKAGKLWLFIGIGAMIFWCLISAASQSLHSVDY